MGIHMTTTMPSMGMKPITDLSAKVMVSQRALRRCLAIAKCYR